MITLAGPCGFWRISNKTESNDTQRWACAPFVSSVFDSEQASLLEMEKETPGNIYRQNL